MAVSGKGRASLTGPGVVSPQVVVRLPARLHAALWRIAGARGVSVSELCREALREHLARQEEQ